MPWKTVRALLAVPAILVTAVFAACTAALPVTHSSIASTVDRHAEDAAAYREMVELSGEKEAASALADQLRKACQISDFAPSPIPELQSSGLMPPTGEFKERNIAAFQDVAECIKTRIVAAFDAEEGMNHCPADDLPDFVACIVVGAYEKRVVGNLGMAQFPPGVIWSDSDEPIRQINDVLFRKALDKCQRSSQWEANNCAEDFVLPALGIDRADISKCPGGKLRMKCISKTGLARFVNDRLLFIF